MQSIRLLFLALVLCSATSLTVAADEYGKFEGEVEVKWDADGRTMTLLKDFAYVDPLGVRWSAPKGSKVDGASIPQWAWSLIGGPYEGPYRKASVVHDVACEKKERPWEAVHLSFYYAMLASGVSEPTAKLMYAAVYWGGPRWPISIKAAKTSDLFAYNVGQMIKASTTSFETGNRVSVIATVRASAVDAPIEIDVSSKPERIQAAANRPDVVSLYAKIAPVVKPIDEGQWPRLRAYVENGNRSLEEIRAFKSRRP